MKSNQQDISEDDPLDIVSYDPSWNTVFEVERDRLISTFHFSKKRIIHFGSTAIPDFEAKNIVDIMIGLEPLVISKKFRSEMMKHGYIIDFIRENWALFYKREGNNPGVNLHFFLFNSEEWNTNLNFRNLLRNDGDIRKQYLKLKKHLALTSKDIVEYSDGKSEFIQRVIKECEKMIPLK